MITALFVLALIGAYSVYQPFVLSWVVAVLLTMATFNLTKTLVGYTGSAHISAAIATTLLTLFILPFSSWYYLAGFPTCYFFLCLPYCPDTSSVWWSI